MTVAAAIPAGFHASWAEVNMDSWRWPHFSPRELACKCGGRHCRGEYFHNPEFLDALETLRQAMGAPLVVTSGRRCAGHNRAVGGASRSQHMVATAVDISLFGHDAVKLARAAVAAGFRGVGFGRTFLHLDWRQTRTAFHYPDGQRIWISWFGRDPAVSLARGWTL